MSRILCEFRFPTGEVKYGVWCDTADLLVTRRTFASKEDAEQFRQRVGMWRGAPPNEEPPPVGSLGEQEVTLYVDYGGGVEFSTRVSQETGWVSGPLSRIAALHEIHDSEWAGFGP